MTWHKRMRRIEFSGIMRYNQIFGDNEVQSDHQIPDRRLNLKFINLQSIEFRSSGKPLGGNKRKLKERQMFDSCQRSEKTEEVKVASDTN